MSCIEYADSENFYVEKEISTQPLLTMHHHRSYELYYLVRGKREYFIEDRFFMVSEGDLVFIPKKVFHRTAGEGGLRFLVHFTDGFLQKYFTDSTLQPLLNELPPVFRGNERDRDHILTLLDTLLTEYTKTGREPSPENEALWGGYLYQLLFTIAHSPNAYVPHTDTDERITQIIQYINENYNHISDIEQIAEHFFISKYHLCRFFSRNLGISLVSYLNTIRIREACSMIAGGCSNMTQVALQCGFNSSSYFCKVFKKETGLSPTDYRKKHK